MTTPLISESEVRRRLIRRQDFVSCTTAFIDCRTPGSDRKLNFAMIGPGVSQNDDQVVNLREPHGFNIGAAGMPNGVVNSLHMHFTAEVFLCFRGEFLLRWGVDGTDGEYLLREGDVASIPTWIFRGFTNVGPDDGILFTALGQDETGGIVWGPSVLAEAERHGLFLTTDSRLVDTVAGDALPPATELVTAMAAEDLAALRRWTPAEMALRVAAHDELRWSRSPFLSSALPGGGAELALVVGFGMTEDRDQEPRVCNPHGFSVAWLRAAPGEGLLRHRHDAPQVLMAKDGGWRVGLRDGGTDAEVEVELGPWDMLSIPPGAWRTLVNDGPGPAELVVVNGGDGRVPLEWDPHVVTRARDGGVVHDANRYAAPLSVVRFSTIDD